MLAATDWPGVGLALAGLAAVIGAIGTTVAQIRTSGRVKEIHAEVATSNGIPMGEMAERQEGRRIAELPVATRTASEQEYVAKLDAGGRNRGHEDDPSPAA